MTSQTASYIAALRRAYAKTTEPGKRSELLSQLTLNGVGPEEPEKASKAKGEPVTDRHAPERQTAAKEATPLRRGVRRKLGRVDDGC